MSSSGPSAGPHAIATRHGEPGDRVRRLRRAALLHLDGDLVGAEAAYVALLGEHPADPAALNNLGLLRVQRGDPAGALEAFAALGSEDGLSPTALLNKANAHLALAEPARAVPLLQRAVNLDAESSAWVALGQAHLMLGDAVAAEAALRQAHHRLPGRVDVLRTYAACLAARGELGSAAGLLADAVRIDANDASSWRQLGALLLSLRDLGSAHHATRNALELEPDHVPTLRQLAVVLLALDRPEESAEALDHALTLRRDTDLLVDRAVLHLAAGEIASARELLEDSVADDSSGRAGLYLGYALLAAGRPDGARDQLRRVTGMLEPFAGQAREALTRVGEQNPDDDDSAGSP